MASTKSAVVPQRSREDVRREWGLQPHHIAVGFVGRFAPEKRPELVAQAVAKLGGDYRAVFVGDGPSCGEAVKSIHSALPSAIVRPPVAQVGDVLGALDCFVLPSRAEGFSLGLAEAWLAGVPTVATPAGALNELEQQHGRLTVRLAGNPTAGVVAAAIGEAVAPDNALNVERARNTVATHYSCSATSAAWTEFIEDPRKALLNPVRCDGLERKPRQPPAPQLSAVVPNAGSGQLKSYLDLIEERHPRTSIGECAGSIRSRLKNVEPKGNASLNKRILRDSFRPLPHCELEACTADASSLADDSARNGDGADELEQKSQFRFENIVGMPRVGFVGPSLWVGGIERWMMGLVRHAKDVHWSGCVCLRDGDIHPDVVREITQLMPVYCDRKVASHVAFTGVPRQCLPSAQDAVEALSRTSDIILLWGTASAETYFPSAFDGRIVLVSHGSEDEWTRQIVVSSAGICTDFVAVSRLALKPFGDLASRATIIDNGIELSRCRTTRPRSDTRRKLGFAPNDIVVGFLGRLSDDKRPEYVAETVAILRSETGGTHYKALYVGDGYLGPRYRQQAKDLLGDAVCLCPPTREIGDMLSAMDCFLLPSPSEGAGLATVEAWACNVPTVTCDTGVVKIANDDHALGAIALPPDASPAHFAMAVKRRDCAEHRSVVTKAKRLAFDCYSAENMGRNWSAYLQRLWK